MPNAAGHSSLHRARVRSRGFSLIELLTVIAVIGILIGIFIPTLSKVREGAKKTKTKVQFSQWANAIEGFRTEYGYYPNFTLFTDGKISDAPKTEQFVQTLTGKRLDGTALQTGDPGLLAGNTKRIPFCAFGTDDLKSGTQLQDAFGNTEIVVLMDRNLSGLVTVNNAAADYTAAAPSVNGLSAGLSDHPAGVRAGVILYSPGAGSSATDVVKSW